MSEIDCSHAVVVGLTPATAVKIADIFTSMRSKLLTVIKNWEASGQGDGGMDREQEDQGDYDEQEDEVLHDKNAELPAVFGSLSQRPTRALDSCAAFVGGMPSYILYYWEVAESQQLLSSAMQRLSDHTNAADAASAPLVSRRRSGGATSVTSTITSSGGSRRRNHRQQDSADEETDDEEMASTAV